MFDVSMSGSKAKVIRTLTLPKTGPLPQLTLSDAYTIQLDLGGIDPKSPVAKEILTAFPKTYTYELNSVRKRYDDPCIKLWADAAKLVASKSDDPTAVEKAATKTQEKIVVIWNEFNAKRAKPLAESTFRSIANNAAKKAKEKAINPKLTFSSEGLKENRVGILSAVLGALTVGAVTGGVSWVLAGLAGFGALAKGYRNAWEISQKQSADVQTSLNQIDDGLESALSTLAKLQPSLSRLQTAQSEAAASIVVAKDELNRMIKEISTLEQRAKQEQAVREGKHLSSLREAAQKQEAKVRLLHSSMQSRDQLGKAVKDAHTAVAAAGDMVTAERKGWDKLMAGYSKVSKDGDTFLSGLAAVLKQFK